MCIAKAYGDSAEALNEKSRKFLIFLKEEGLPLRVSVPHMRILHSQNWRLGS